MLGWLSLLLLKAVAEESGVELGPGVERDLCYSAAVWLPRSTPPLLHSPRLLWAFPPQASDNSRRADDRNRSTGLRECSDCGRRPRCVDSTDPDPK